uniref:Chromosome 16 open reading frame 87 n=4 Tax=Catarrhini TaxID=9526 RepID=A0A8I5P3E3_PAPAN
MVSLLFVGFISPKSLTSEIALINQAWKISLISSEALEFASIFFAAVTTVADASDQPTRLTSLLYSTEQLKSIQRSKGIRVPVACKSCPCGYIFISRKLLNAKHSEKSPPSTENKHEAKRRRTERVRREKINSTVNKDLENRKRSRSNSHSDHIRRGRGRPKSASAKKHEEEREKQEKEIDIYANLSDEKAFVFSVALAEINRKIINQRLIL